MLKTVRYHVIGDKKYFLRYDALQIDPMATERQAVANVDASRLIEAMETESRDVIRREYLKFRKAIRDYGMKNPVHFHPRENEVVLCPLLVSYGKESKRDNSSPVD